MHSGTLNLYLTVSGRSLPNFCRLNKSRKKFEFFATAVFYHSTNDLAIATVPIKITRVCEEVSQTVKSSRNSSR